MAFGTFNLGSETVYLFTAAPVSGYELKCSLPAQADRALDGRETRFALAANVRCALTFTAHLTDSDVPDFRTALQAAQNAPFAVPCWPLLVEYGDRATVQVNAGLWVAWSEDWSHWAVGVGSPPAGFADHDFLAPLLVGMFSGTVDPVTIEENCVQVGVSLDENRPQSWIAPNSTAAFPSGPSATSGVTQPLLPFRFDHGQTLNAGRVDYSIDRQELGYLRQRGEAFYSQSPERVVSGTIVLPGNGWVELLRFFCSQQGIVVPLWVPAVTTETTLTADANSTDTTLSVAGIAQLGGNRFLLLDDLVNRVPVQATSATNPIPLSGPVGTSFSAQSTRIESLMLARFAEPQITFAFEGPDWATATVGFRELPAEYALATGETYGTTIGPMPTVAHLYRFTIQYPSAPAVFRFTAFEFDVNDGANTWTSGLFEHGEITDSLNLEDNSVDIKTRVFAGNPLNLTSPLTLEFPMTVEIFEAHVTGSGSPVPVGNITRVFLGEAGLSTSDGPFLSVRCSRLRALAVREVPRMLYSVRCNYNTYTGGCPAVKANHTFAGTVISGVTSATTLSVQSSGAAWTSGTVPAHTFAGAMISTGAGATLVNRWVADSSAPVAGIVTLTLSQPITVATGNAVSLVLQCDRTYATCRGTFGSDTGNGAAFGGVPWMPISAPLYQVKNPNAGSKKS